MAKLRKIFFIFIPFALLGAVLVLGASARSFLGESQGCPCLDLESTTGEFSPGEKKALFDGKEIFAPLAQLPEVLPKEQKVLGEVKGEEKWIEIDLSEQKLWAWEDDNLFLETLVSSGKWGRTPTGEFRIWTKFKYAKMSGGSRAIRTYYYLPNVPYIMYFANSQIPPSRGYGLHGTYWHNNFGYVMSHGCVNLPTPVAEKLFYWTTPSLPLGENAVRTTSDNPGTRIVIHE